VKELKSNIGRSARKIRRSGMPFRRTSRNLDDDPQVLRLLTEEVRPIEDLGCESDIVLATTAIKWPERGLPPEPLGVKARQYEDLDDRSS